MSCMENCVWTIPSLLSSRSKGGSDPTCRPGWQCTHSVILNQYSSFNVMIPLLLFSLSLFWQPDRNQDCLNSQILFGFSYFRLCRKLLVKKKIKAFLVVETVLQQLGDNQSHYIPLHTCCQRDGLHTVGQAGHTARPHTQVTSALQTHPPLLCK